MKVILVALLAVMLTPAVSSASPYRCDDQVYFALMTSLSERIEGLEDSRERVSNAQDYADLTLKIEEVKATRTQLIRTYSPCRFKK